MEQRELGMGSRPEGCHLGSCEGAGQREMVRVVPGEQVRGGGWVGPEEVEAGWALGSGLVALAVMVSRSPAACGERCEGKG